MHALFLLFVLRCLPLMIFLLHFLFFRETDVCAYPGSCLGSCLGSCSLYSKKRKVFLLIKQQLPEQLPGSDGCRFSIGFLRKVSRGGSPWPMKFSSLGSCWGSCLGSCCQLLRFHRSKTRGGEFGRVWLQQSRSTRNRAAPL